MSSKQESVFTDIERLAYARKNNSLRIYIPKKNAIIHPTVIAFFLYDYWINIKCNFILLLRSNLD